MHVFPAPPLYHHHNLNTRAIFTECAICSFVVWSDTLPHLLYYPANRIHVL